MTCTDRQLSDAQRAAAFEQNRNAGAIKAIRPFSGEATPENLVDYLNREVFPVLKQARSAVNEIYRQVTDNAPSGNPLGYFFSTIVVDADPGSGRMRLNNATEEDATIIRVSELNQQLKTVVPWLDVMAGSSTAPLGVVTLFTANDPSRFIRWDLNTMTDQGTYWDLGVTFVESSHDNPFVDDDQVVLSFIPGVASTGTTVPPGSITPIADETFLGNVSGSPAPPTAIALSTLAGTGLTWDSAGNNFDVTVPFVPQGWDDTLSVDNNSGAFNPHIDDGQFLSFGIEGSIPGSGDIRSSDALTINVTGAAALVGSTTASITGGGSNGFAASAAAVILGAGTSGITVNNNSLIRLTTGGTERLEIEATGGWQLGGLVGTAGQYMRSAGAGASPAWATISIGELGAISGNSIVANATAASAVPTAVAVGANTVVGRAAGDLVAAQLVTGQVANNAITNGKLAQAAANTIKANITAALADVADVAVNADSVLARVGGNLTSHPWATLAGGGLTYGAGVMAVGAGTGLTVNANDVQISTITAESFFMNNTAGVAVPVAVAGSTVAGAGLTYTTGGILAVGAGTGLTVNANDVQLSTLAAETFFGNFTAGAAVGTARSGSSVAGGGLTYTAGGTLAVGAGTGITVNANDIAVTNPAVATTGAVIIGAGGGASTFGGILDNGAAENNRTNLNFINSLHLNASVTDDSGNDELEVTYTLDLTDAYTWTGNHTWSGTLDFTVDVTGIAQLRASSGVLMESTSTDVAINAAGNVEVTADALVLSGDGFLVIEGATASTPSLTANFGLFWVFDPGARKTVPAFKADDNVDTRLHQVGPNTILNVSGTVNGAAIDHATSALQCTANTTLNGINAGFDGQAIDVYVSGNFTLTANHASGSATGSPLSLKNAAAFGPTTRGGMRLIYDEADVVWRCVATN